MKQRAFQIYILARYFQHIKRPQNLRHEQSPLNPSNLPTNAGSRTYTKGEHALEIIIRELGIVERMSLWEPALGAVFERIVEVLWASNLCEDAVLDGGLLE